MARGSLAVFALSLAASAAADSPIMPYTRVTASPDGTHYVVMVSNYNQEQDRYIGSGSGSVYRVLSDGSSVLLYAFEGWYALQVRLTDDGRYLARMGPWHGGSAPQSDDLAVAFYDRGREIKRYLVPDLLNDPRNVGVTSNHYSWEAGWPHYPRVEFVDRLLIRTVEERILVFDMTNGAIVDQYGEREAIVPPSFTPRHIAHLVAWTATLAIGFLLPFWLHRHGVRPSRILITGMLMLALSLALRPLGPMVWGLHIDRDAAHEVYFMPWLVKLVCWVLGLWCYSFIAHGVLRSGWLRGFFTAR